MSFGHTRRLLVERLSEPMKNCRRRSVSGGYTCSQKTLFLTRNPDISEALAGMH
jgi:hypothetical protein